MGGFRLSATARENIFWGGSTDLGRRSKRPLVVNDGDPIFAYIPHIQRLYDDVQKLAWEDLGEKRETEEKRLRNLILEQFFYRHKPFRGGSWTTK